jgi:ABC-type sugar transport system substrate-binding protein
MRRIAMLLCDEHNAYEQALARSARAAARERGAELLPPHYADISSVNQLSAIFTFQRQSVDGYVLVAVNPDVLTSAIEALLRSGAAVAFLNRAPADFERLRRENSAALCASVVPDQRQIGRLQGEQCLRLVPSGGTVLHVMGADETSSARDRRAGFLEVVGSPSFEVHELDGRWSASASEDVLGRWFKVGAARQKRIDAVICQNDAMALGARSALLAEAARADRPELAAVPVTGVDGVPEDGQRRVQEGSLSATVVMPLTSGPAVHALCDFWAGGRRAGSVVLPADPYPELDSIRPGP